MPTSRRDRETLQQIAEQLAGEDPALAAQFRDWAGSTRHTTSCRPRGSHFAKYLWAPQSFVAALVGVLLLAVPVCVLAERLSRHPATALVLLPLLAGCLLPVYRYLRLCEE